MGACGTRAARFLLVIAGCGGGGSTPGPVVCEGSTADPVAECDDGYCVDGETCKPIFDDCGEFEVPVLGGGCQRVGLPENCWDGWVPDGDGGCEPILPEGDCPTGTMPVIGRAECQPVGPPQDCWLGWVNDGDGGCEPILPAGDCPDGTMEIIGQATCQPIGDCSAPPPTGATVRVVDASVGPYTTIQSAIDAANPGDTVFVTPGEYVEDVDIAKAIRVEGQCAEAVTIRGTGAEPFAVDALGTSAGSVEIRGVTLTGAAGGIQVSQRPDVVIEDVTVRDCEGIGVQVIDDAQAEIRRSLVINNRELGLDVYQAIATIEEVVVRGTRPNLGGAYGRGVQLDAADVTIRRSIFSGNRQTGMLANASTATLDEVVVRDTLSAQDSGLSGRGIAVQGASSDVVIRRSLVAGNRAQGVLVDESTVTVENAIVRDTWPDLDGTGGNGLAIQDSASVSVGGSLVAGNREMGVFVAGSAATFEDVVVRDTLAQAASGLWGGGIEVRNSSTTGESSDVTLTRCLVSGNRDRGVLVFDSTAALVDVVVRDTLGRDEDGAYGGGIYVDNGSNTVPTPAVAITRGLVTGNRYEGISIFGSTVTMDEVVVSDTLPEDASGLFGRGISVARHPETEVNSNLGFSRSLVSGFQDLGVMVHASTASLDEVTIRNTRPGEGSEHIRGINAQRGSDLTVSRSLVSGSRQVAIAVDESMATLTESIVRDTSAAELDGIPFVGDAIGVLGPNAGANLWSILVMGSARAGVYFSDAGGSLNGSVIRDNEFAAALEEGANPEIGQDNLFEGNGRNDVAVGLGLEPAPPLEEDPGP